MTQMVTRKGEPKERDGAESEQRTELLNGIADYVLDHGLAGFSLRPLASAVGTSTRQLTSMFGGTDELLQQVLDALRTRQLSGLRAVGNRASGIVLTKALEQYWNVVSSKQSEPFLRLFFESYGLALQDPVRFASFLDGAIADWLGVTSQILIAAGVPARQRKPLGTLVVDTYRGLLLDLVTTGDRPRVDAACREFIRMVDLRLKPGRA